MENIIIILILVCVIGLAAGYVYKAKKSGKKCIGCPESGSCPGKMGEFSCCCECNSKKN